jgi:arginine-tRNA-protein transferase
VNQKESKDFSFLEENTICSYFEDRVADMHYRYREECSNLEQYKMLERGWRRFGNMHFVPVCKNCNDCKTIRLDIANYKFSKSEKRIFRKNQDVDVYINSPTLTLEHINLFNKYHKYMTKKKGWDVNQITKDEYYRSYVVGAHDYGKELLYFLDNKLIAVALLDVMKEGYSAVYCYYDHDYENRSLGKFSIILQINLAKQNKVPYLFLGYWIKDHYSMGYKENYKPFDILQNRPSLDEKTIWSEYA